MWEGPAVHMYVILGAMRKETEQAMRSKPVQQPSFMASASVPVFRFLLNSLDDGLQTVS